jgi:Uma2 family endonuclease
MSPIGFRHATAVSRLSKKLTLLARERYDVRAQSPFILDSRSMPEPDVSLVDIVTDSLPHLPKTEHIYLAIEVSDSTLAFDGGEKKEAYALQGIPEYWLLNLRDNVMEIYREPQGDQYRVVEKVGPSGFVSPVEFPDIKLRVGDYIP